MTVRELKELLTKFDDNDDVYIYDSEFRCLVRIGTLGMEPAYENSVYINTYEDLVRLGKRLNDAVVINGEGNNAS